jgi:hypothetical protein
MRLGVSLGSAGDFATRVGALDRTLSFIQDLLRLLQERLHTLDKVTLVAVVFFLSFKLLDVLNER